MPLFGTWRQLPPLHSTELNPGLSRCSSVAYWLGRLLIELITDYGLGIADWRPASGATDQWADGRWARVPSDSWFSIYCRCLERRSGLDFQWKSHEYRKPPTPKHSNLLSGFCLLLVGIRKLKVCLFLISISRRVGKVVLRQYLLQAQFERYRFETSPIVKYVNSDSKDPYFIWHYNCHGSNRFQ